TFATKPCVWGRIAAHWAQVPVIVGTLPGLGSLYADNNGRTRFLRALYRPLQRTACSVSDLTIFQNRDDALELIATGMVQPAKARGIPGSGVRTNLFDPALVSREEREMIRREANAGSGSVVFTMVSRVIRSKGALEFANAARLVRERVPEAEFVLVGPDDREARAHLKAEEVEYPRSSVRWLGPRDDVRAVLAASDVFVLPSFYREGIPRVLLEAASMGLPIITTNSPGCVEVVEDDRNGILVAPRDPGSLAEAIVRMAAAKDLRRRYGAASRDRAIRYFDLAV